MPNQDGLTPGGDGSADTKSGNGADDGAAKNKSGNGSEGDKAGGDKGTKDDDDGKAGQVVFGSQKELDDLIARRVSRATKKAEDDAKLTEQQRIEKERDDALALVRERDIRDDFVAKADVSPTIARRIYAAYKDDIDIDDKGKATNIDEVIKTAKKEMPALFSKSVVKPGGGDGGSGTGGEGVKAGEGGMNNALRQMAGRGNAS
jgi:hypothetical protein